MSGVLVLLRSHLNEAIKSRVDRKCKPKENSETNDKVCGSQKSHTTNLGRF